MIRYRSDFVKNLNANILDQLSKLTHGQRGCMIHRLNENHEGDMAYWIQKDDYAVAWALVHKRSGFKLPRVHLYTATMYRGKGYARRLLARAMKFHGTLEGSHRSSRIFKTLACLDSCE